MSLKSVRLRLELSINVGDEHDDAKVHRRSAMRDCRLHRVVTSAEGCPIAESTTVVVCWRFAHSSAVRWNGAAAHSHAPNSRDANA